MFVRGETKEETRWFDADPGCDPNAPEEAVLVYRDGAFVPRDPR